MPSGFSTRDSRGRSVARAACLWHCRRVPEDHHGETGRLRIGPLPEVIPSLWPRLTRFDRWYAKRYYVRIVADPSKYDWMLKLGHSEWRYAQLACTLAFYAASRFIVISVAAPVLLIFFGVQSSAVLIGLGLLAGAAVMAGLIERFRIGHRCNAYFRAGTP